MPRVARLVGTRGNPIIIGGGRATKRRTPTTQTDMFLLRQAGKRRSMDRRTGGFLDLETKFKDFRVNDKAFTDVWAGGEMEDATALSVSATLVGDGESERNGRVYHIKSIHIQGTVERSAEESAAAPRGDNVVRIVLVWDKQSNGAQLNAEDVFLTISAGHDIDSYRNLQFVKRFQVLADRKIRLPVATTVVNEGAINLFAQGQSSMPFRINHIFKRPLKVTCKGTTAVIASITDNSLHVIGCGNDTSATLSYTSRLRFVG